MDKNNKKKLRSLINGIKPVFQIGKNGIDENISLQIRDYLEKHELCKIKVICKTAKEDTKKIANILADNTKSKLVEVKGFTLTLYLKKQNTKKKE